MAIAAASHHFSKLESDICSTFITLVGLLDKRKNTLLGELHTLRQTFDEKHEPILDKLKELEDSMRELQTVLKNLKGNQSVEQINSSIAKLKKTKTDLESQLPKPRTIFDCDLPTLQDVINNKVVLLTVAPRKPSGLIPPPPEMAKKLIIPRNKSEQILQIESDLNLGIDKEMSQPIPPKIGNPIILSEKSLIRKDSIWKLSLPRKSRNSSLLASDISKVIRFIPSKGVIAYPNGICIHNESNRVFICDNGGRVHIWSLDGDYLFEFGGEILKNPYGVVIMNNFIFVTDMGKSSIFKFTTDNYCFITNSMVMSPEYTHTPDHVSSDGSEIFVANDVPSISVFTGELKLVRTLETKQLTLTTGIVARKGCLFILELETNLIHLLNSQTGYMISQISTNRDSVNFTHANNFCMDSDCNFLITDLKSHLIKKINTYGSFIKTVDTGEMECYQPNAIAITDTDKVVVTFRSGECSHLLFDSF